MSEHSPTCAASSAAPPKCVPDALGGHVFLNGSDVCQCGTAYLVDDAASIAGTPEQTEARKPSRSELRRQAVMRGEPLPDLTGYSPSATPASSDVPAGVTTEPRFTDDAKFCNALVGDEGRWVCRFPKGHDGPHHPHANARVAPEAFDYPAAARSLALNLAEFCDESLPYPQMIAEAGRRARREIERLRSPASETATTAQDECSNPNCQWLKCAGGLSSDLTRFGRQLDRVCEAVGVESMKNPEPQADAAIAAIEALRSSSDPAVTADAEFARSLRFEYGRRESDSWAWTRIEEWLALNDPAFAAANPGLAAACRAGLTSTAPAVDANEKSPGSCAFPNCQCPGDVPACADYEPSIAQRPMSMFRQGTASPAVDAGTTEGAENA